METFLTEVIEGEKAELCIDTSIFNKDIVFKACYNLLDKAYFFFSLNKEGNLIVQCTKKGENEEDVNLLLHELSDEILSVYLRDKLEKDNKDIREKIVGAAIANSLDSNNFIQIDTDKKTDEQNNEIDFDKDIDEILKEIENDPDLKIDEEEIEKILKEIEEETEGCNFSSNKPSLNINAVKDVKKKFQNRA